MMNIRKLTESEVTFTIAYEPESIGVRGNYMATGNPDADRADEDEVIERLCRGDESAWCTVVVTAHWNGVSASDSLGCCVLTDEYTADVAANEHGMRQEALERLNAALARNFNKMSALISNDPPPDTRSMADLANEAIRVQDACNLSGVVYGFGKAISRLRVLLREQGRESTEEVNTHPISKAWASKINDLAQNPEHRGLVRDSLTFWDDLYDLATRE